MEKDLHFSDKKVDESWKASVEKDQTKQPASGADPKKEAEKPKTTPESRKKFIDFLMGLASQALYLMGAREAKGGQDLEHAQEIIAVLQLIKDRTEGNLSAEEKRVFEKILYELQMTCAEALRSKDQPKAGT